MLLLKQSTAAILKMGPFVDETDGVTAETGLTISQADIQISKNGGAFAQTSDASPTTTHDADGWYPIPLTTTDTNTLGTLVVQVTESGALPVWIHAMVVPAAVYDSLVAGSDTLPADVTQWNGTNVATPDTAGYPKTTIKSGTGTGEISLSSGRALVQGQVKKNTALSNYMFLMIDSSDDIAGKTGLTVTAERSIDGGAFAACANAVSEVANGVYKIDLAAADLNGDVVVLKFTASEANTSFDRIITIA